MGTKIIYRVKRDDNFWGMVFLFILENSETLASCFYWWASGSQKNLPLNGWLKNKS